MVAILKLNDCQLTANMSSSNLYFVLILKHFKIKILSRELLFCYDVSVPVQSAYKLNEPMFNENIYSIKTMTISSLKIVNEKISLRLISIWFFRCMSLSCYYYISCNHQHFIFKVQLIQVLSTWCIENKYIYSLMSLKRFLSFIIFTKKYG